MQIFVINLDRSPERFSAMQTEFAKVRLEQHLNRISAIDATDPGFAAPGYTPHSWRDRWELKRSEQAVFESHRAVWRRIADIEDTVGIVCEDDIFVSTAFPSLLAALEGQHFGVVKLDGFNAMRRYGPATEMNGWQLRAIVEPVPSAACYAVSSAAARRLLADGETYCETLDDFVFRARTGVDPVQLFPAVAVQQMCCISPGSEGVQETSQRERQDSSKAAKGPAPYRVVKEIRRSLRKRNLRGFEAYMPALCDDLPRYRDA
ncbi:glycosyltransferase family 25 protein [Ruegeria sp. 2205SS24-7]|uniref:glycosyltransferase family 25 protein n=1 Tax=Ruegeria discodermiae TaxID=3064389 RepID=UPI0027419744|nr:glycosyltransferase family 25 protein [Ruegeria sp. 2205SS24-7]MDP5217882.1 glycosyltransferase family 25 protein [Ruegeria sp. 2205SS24-7]